jgi:hypothetical protein
MTGTMTSVDLDVHARSIDAAAICVRAGEVDQLEDASCGYPLPV